MFVQDLEVISQSNNLFLTNKINDVIYQNSNTNKRILNDSKATDFICPVDWQVIRTGMIQDVGKDKKPEQDKWDRIINIIDTQGESTGVHTQGETPIVTPGNNSALRVSLNNLNKYIYTV